MKVIGYTDVIQVTVLIIGGIATIYLALSIVGEKLGEGNSIVQGFKTLMKNAPDHFHMILQKPTAASTQIEIDKYLILPGIAMYYRRPMDSKPELLGMQPVHYATCPRS